MRGWFFFCSATHILVGVGLPSYVRGFWWGEWPSCQWYIPIVVINDNSSDLCLWPSPQGKRYTEIVFYYAGVRRKIVYVTNTVINYQNPTYIYYIMCIHMCHQYLQKWNQLKIFKYYKSVERVVGRSQLVINGNRKAESFWFLQLYRANRFHVRRQ